MFPDPLLDPIRRDVAELGFDLIDLRCSGPPERPLLQLRIDRPDGAPGPGVTVGDCAAVTRSLRHGLIADGRIGPEARVEVSSPGLDRPVRFPEHWRRYVGRWVRIRARDLHGHPRATIVAVPDEEHVSLRLADQTEIILAFRDLREAVLVADENELKGKP